jgi:signal transduction histidine kinase
MRSVPVRIRTFILGTVLVLLLLPAFAGASAFVLERRQQQAAVQRRLDAAATYLTANRTEMQKPSRVRAFAALLDRLGLFAELNLVGKVPPGKKELYISPALIPAVSGGQVRQLKTSQARASRSGTTVPTAAGKTPATGDRRVERVIPVVTRDTAGALIADLYSAPPSRSDQALAALLAGVGVLLAGLAVAFWLAGRWMVTPLTRLSAQVDKVAGGDLEIATPRSRIGEIANIAQAVEGMTAALSETAQRRAEADEARRFLVTSVAHDLRTPLFALRGHLQAMRSRLGDPAVHLARAEARADALERLVGNLFAFTRDDYMQSAVQLDAVSVVGVLEEVTAALEHAALLGGNRFELTGDAAVTVDADRDRFKRALTNILDNALRYSPRGGRVRLHWAPLDASTVEITVRDEGPGIDPDLLPHIFEPGIRGTTSSDNGDTGAGLGLAIARRLLEAQEATVIACNRPDGGAEIRVKLRRAPSNGPKGVGRREPGGADRREKAGERADREGRRQAARPGQGRDDGCPVLAVGIGGSRDDADRHSGEAAEQGEQDGFGQELGADVSLGGAESAA